MKVQAYQLLANGQAHRDIWQNEARGLTQLANLGVAAQVAGSGAYGPFWRPQTDRVERTRTESVYTQKPVTLTENLYAERQTVERREILSERDVFEDRPVFEDQAVFEDRDVFEDRAVYETRTVYTQREIRETEVTGNRSLQGFARLSNAGIDTGADFAVTVDGNATAKIKFATASRLTVTVGATTQTYNFTSNDGSWRTALVDALNSVVGLDAALTSDGRLQLSTENAQSLTIADIANGIFDFSGSPLAALGLTPGTTHAAVVGHESVATGTEQVLIGTERVRIGSERVQTGVTQVQVGTQSVLTGRESYVSGSEAVVTGSRRVKVGEKTTTLASETVRSGTRVVHDGYVDEIVGIESLTTNALWKRRAGFDYVRLLFSPVEPRDDAAGLNQARSGYAEFAPRDRDNETKAEPRSAKLAE